MLNIEAEIRTKISLGIRSKVRRAKNISTTMYEGSLNIAHRNNGISISSINNFIKRKIWYGLQEENEKH